jgi:hypothetical protein
VRFTPERIVLNPLDIATVGDGPLSIYQPLIEGTVYIGMGIDGHCETRLTPAETDELAALVGRITERVTQLVREQVAP